MGVSDGGSGIVDELQCLRKHEAIKLVRGDCIGGSQVDDDRCVWIFWVDIEDITLLDSGPVPIGVATISNFEYATTDIQAVLFEKAVDVVTIEGRPSIKAPVIAQGGGSSESAEPRWAGKTAKALAHAMALFQRKYLSQVCCDVV